MFDIYSFDYLKFGLKEDVARNYYNSLIAHIENVREAGRKLGVSNEQLMAHDLSKFGGQEFPAYANRFFGEPDEDRFMFAWLHHLHNNPHHWDHWVFPRPKTQGIQFHGVLPMPDRFALEMVADWMGAGKSYQGSWDMTGWLKENLPNIMLHPITADYVKGVLLDLGYNFVKNDRIWWHNSKK